jgi:hypothetical protein
MGGLSRRIALLGRHRGSHYGVVDFSVAERGKGLLIFPDLLAKLLSESRKPCENRVFFSPIEMLDAFR